MHALATEIWSDFPAALLKMCLAYLLAMPIGWNREKKRRSHTAGLRTFPLVATGACGYMLIGLSLAGGSVDAVSRIIYGIITGIGFIGGGAILKDEGHVSGTATAASIWIMGGIGIACAAARYDIAILLSAISAATFYFVGPIMKKEFKRLRGERKARPGRHPEDYEA